MDKIDTVKYSRYKKCLDSIERNFKGTPRKIEDIDISFEYVIGSLFPKSYQNIKDLLTERYIEGYNEGKKELQTDSYFNSSCSPRSQLLINGANDYINIAINQLELAERKNNNEEKIAFQNAIRDLNNIKNKLKYNKGDSFND